MDAKQLFTRYVEQVGGRAEAAAKLGISVGMVGHIELGRRDISVKIAKRIEAATGGEISRHELRPDVFGPITRAA